MDDESSRLPMQTKKEKHHRHYTYSDDVYDEEHYHHRKRSAGLRQRSPRSKQKGKPHKTKRRKDIESLDLGSPRNEKNEYVPETPIYEY